LWKTLYSFSDLHIHVAIVGDFLEVVKFVDFGRDLVDRDSHILISLHGHVEIKTLDIESTEWSSWCGDDTVKEDFGCVKT
jgi:hypothetical protein